jgi:hypothetical protein
METDLRRANEQGHTRGSPLVSAGGGARRFAIRPPVSPAQASVSCLPTGGHLAARPRHCLWCCPAGPVSSVRGPGRYCRDCGLHL